MGISPVGGTGIYPNNRERLIQNGMSVYEVREILGHGDIKTTMRYAHLEQRQVTSKARDVINRLNHSFTKSV
jgi:integrase